MKIALTPHDLSRGKKAVNFKEKKMALLKNAALSRLPVHITTTLLDGKKYSIILPTDLTGEVNYTILEFVPIWNRTFKVCSTTSKKITALVIEFTFGKFEVDDAGYRPTTKSTSGPGCDPMYVEASEGELALLLQKHAALPIAGHVAALIRKSF